MAVTTDKDPKPEPAAAEQKKEKKKKNQAGEARREKADAAGQKKNNAEEKAMNNSLRDKHHHNRQLLARLKMMTIPVLNMVSEGNNNAEAEIIPGNAVVTATLPDEEINNIDNTVPEANQFADVMNIKESVVSETKSIDDETSETRGNEIVREEEQEDLNAAATMHGTGTTLTTSVPPQEANNINYVAETRGNEIVRDEELEELNIVDATIHGTSDPPQDGDSINHEASQVSDLNTKESVVVPEPKSTMDEANNSNDVNEGKRKEKLTKSKQNASNAEATNKTENKAQRQKEEDIDAKRIEASGAQSEPDKEQDVETKRAVEAGITTEENPCESRFDTESSWGKEQDIEAIGVKEDAAAKKREKKRRQKKNKAEKLDGKNKSEKLDGVFQSVGVLSLALVCLLIYNFL